MIFVREDVAVPDIKSLAIELGSYTRYPPRKCLNSVFKTTLVGLWWRHIAKQYDVFEDVPNTKSTIMFGLNFIFEPSLE
jgi:hypothetical protein